MSFTAPIINWAALAPALLVLGGGVLGVLVEAFAPRASRHTAQVVLGLASILAAGVALAQRWEVVPAGGWAPMTQGLNEDPFAVATQGVLLLIGFLALLVMADRTSLGDGAFAAQAADRPGSAEEAESLHAGWTTTEVFPLALLSLGGMMLFGAASDLITLFVVLELVSLPLYIMAATARHRRLLSQEAAVKYFVLGAFASALMLMGAALLYGLSGAVDYATIGQALTAGAQPGTDYLALCAVAMVTIGLLFKIAAVPFHAWSPDVYQGAPTPVTGFMAAGVKAAAFFALVRFHYVLAGLLGWDLAPFLWTVAIATMVVGTVVGLVQHDVKRMLAYSAIAHAGFMLIGIIAYNSAAISALVLYALTYGVATVGAFGLISLVRSSQGGAVGGERSDLEAFKGLARRSPWAAGAMTVFLLSFAGIPLTAGFTAKFQLFVAGAQGGAAWLVILAVLCSAATAFFYMRLIVLMHFHEPEEEAGGATAVVASRGLITVAVAVAVAATIALGVLPQAVIELLARAAMLLP
ncbi:NADH-quinone oxidoreductase subunit NuoN [Actinomyces bowdenii]|uniref:NADH-quinone oxidoreductase subunit N n=1 Tax=Actinomyces bowdenii TaxID=131109 RepID=A0A3P1V5T8_9ACTO|nr:NADH-quinone oxidoreductase subunit NuoN [Actinomyces bowdenii]RRD29501.1 NADH-quinone oxidoreductase subunit NuoN [Actinomyces bowdenii]